MDRLKLFIGLLLPILSLESGNRKLFTLEGIRYSLRITKIDMCEASHRKIFLDNVIFRSYDLQQYLFCDVNVTQDMTIKRMSVTIERCSNEGITCEYFQTWNFSRICNIAFMKGQIWSPVVQTTVPKFSCPHVKKNLYKMVNTTIDVNKVIQLYPQVAKYRWKGDARTFDIDDHAVHCVRAEGHLVQSAKRTAV